MTTDLLTVMVTNIIREQELVIGPLAWIEATKVAGLQIIDQRVGTVLFTDSDHAAVINRLVGQYEQIFGRASREVSKDAVRALMANMLPAEIPESLR